MATVFKLMTELGLDSRGFNRGINDAGGRVDSFASKGKSMFSKMGGAFGGMAKIAGGVLGAQVIGKAISSVKGFMTGAIDAGGDATEMLGKFDVTFGKLAQSTSDDLDSFANATGRSRYQMKEMAADFGAVLKGMKLSEGATSDYSTKLAQLAVDVGSFTNVQADVVMQKFRAGITGEYESLKSLGIVINSAMLDQELFNMGIEKGSKVATQAQKVQARYNLIMAATADAQGDAARTADSWANQQVALKAVWKDFMTDVGMGSTKALGPMLKQVVALGRKALPKLAKTITGKILPGVGRFVSKGIELGGVIADLVRTGKTDKPIEEMFGSGAVRAIEVIRKMIEGFKGGGLFGGLKALFSSAWTGLKKKATTEWGPKLWSALTAAWEGLKTKATTEWGPKLWMALTTAWEGLKTKAKTEWGPRLWKALTRAWEGLKEKAPVWKEKLQTAIGTAWEGLQEKAPVWKAKLQAAIGTAWEGLQEKAPVWKEKLQTAIGTAWEGLKEKAPVWGAKLKTAVTTAWDYIQENAPVWKTKLQAALTTAWDGLEAKAPAWGAKLNTAVGSAVTWLQENSGPSAMKLGTSLGVLLSKAEQHFVANSSDIGAKIGKAIGTVIRVGIGLLVGQIAAFATLLFNFFKGLITGSTKMDKGVMDKALLDFFGGLLDGLMVGLTGDPQWAASLGEFFVGLWDDVKKWADEIATKIEGIGTNLVAGLLKGLEGAWGTVETKFQELIGKLPMWAQKLLGIASASKVSTYWGEMVGLGFSKGLDKSKASVLEKVGDWINSIVNAFSVINSMGSQGTFNASGAQARVDAVAALLLYTIDKLQDLQNRFGYKQIKTLQNTAKRFKVILESVLLDLAGIKEMALPDLDTWFGQLSDLFGRVMGFLGHVRETFGQQAVEMAADIAGDVGTVFGILGTSLAVEAPPVNFAVVLTLFLAGLALAAPKIITLLQELATTYGGDVLGRLAGVAESMGKIFGILGVGKSVGELTLSKSLAKGEKRLPLVGVLTGLLSDLKMGAELIMPWLGDMDTMYGEALEQMTSIADKIARLFSSVAAIGKSAAEIGSTKFKIADVQNTWGKVQGLADAQMQATMAQIAPQLNANVSVGGEGSEPDGPQPIILNIILPDGTVQSYPAQLDESNRADINLGAILAQNAGG